MNNSRIIVQLLIENGKLVKTRKFRDKKYVGDPINAIKIFNEKAVDELVITDMSACKNGINFNLIKNMVTEAFIPVCYSGGIVNILDAKRLFKTGVEKICLTSSAINNLNFIKKLVEVFGSQSIVINVNVKKNIWGKTKIYDALKKKTISLNLDEHIKNIINCNVGELIINDVDRDGELTGLNIGILDELLNVGIPIILSGGLRVPNELVIANKEGASGVMGASCFVFKGPHRAVLISYPFGGGYEIMKRCTNDTM